MKIKKHIPNILSSLRLLSPFVLVPLILSGNLLTALIALSSFLLTDAMDGYLARKWHVQSELGAKIDVVADKVILASLLVPLAINNPILIITLTLEGLISLTNIYRKVKDGNPKTIQFGRIKMVIISLFMAISYLAKIISISNFIINSMFLITTLFQLGTLSNYIKCGLKEINDLKIKSDKNNDKESDKNKEIDITREFNKEKKVDKSNDKISKLEILSNDKNELLRLKEELLGNNIEENNNKTLIKSRNMSKK